MSDAPPKSDRQTDQSTSELSSLSEWYCCAVYLNLAVAIPAATASYTGTLVLHNDRIYMWELPYYKIRMKTIRFARSARKFDVVREQLATVWLRLKWELLRSGFDFELFDYIRFGNRNVNRGVDKRISDIK